MVGRMIKTCYHYTKKPSGFAIDGINQLSAGALCTLYIVYTKQTISQVQKGFYLQSQANTQLALHIIHIKT